MKMMKYSSKLIRDYINGEDIIGYDIEELENDYEFMMEVILVSGDQNMYEMCSDNVKGNYEFACFLINKFIKDKKFVSKVAINYINNENDNEKKNEMCIYLNNLSYHYEDMMEYRVVAKSIYTAQMAQNQLILSELDEFAQEELGTGFSLIIDEYPNSKLIHDFFAVNMIDEILSNYNVETLLHRMYKDAGEVQVNNFLLLLIRNFDKYLALHAEKKLYLLDIYRKNVENYIKHWSYYEEVCVDEVLYQYDILCDKMYNGFPHFPEEFLIYEVNKLNLEHLFNRNESYLDRKEFLRVISIDEKNFDKNKLTPEEQVFLLETEYVINSVFFEEKNDAVKSENGKFIKVDFGRSI